MIPGEWFELARTRINPHVVRTPLTYDAQRDLFLKWENHQVTGSFKARGALNKVLALEDWERGAGLVAASAGNHGQGVALAARLTGAKVEVFVPVRAVPEKVDAIRRLGGDVHFVDGGYGQAETAAKESAQRTRRTFISPYNDGQVVAGQGTLALETVEQLREQFGLHPTEISTWIFPTGGGGLIAGCGAALASAGLKAALYGVQPSASAFTHSLFHRHTQLGVADGQTLADGLSGSIDEDSITIPMMREFATDIVTVSEEMIERAIAYAWWSYGERIEGSASVGLASALEGALKARHSVIVVSGGNIQDQVFEEIVARHRIGAEP
ncbi:MAG TPA: pyridoxal-phosphate dependent enzyme [Anaerolineales bacterium]|nr:pyridoxal-phosphate dependent enzyme [Anaerolineales bacterium]